MNTEHDAIRDLIPAYALGALEDAERVRVEAHLQTCAACRAEWALYRGLVEDLHYAVPPAIAPSRLEQRLRRQIEATSLRRARRAFPTWRMLALAAAFVLLLAGNVYWVQRVRTLQEEVRIQATALAALAEAPTVHLQGDPPAPNARGVLYVRPNTHVALLHVYNLPPLPADKAYQVWLIYNGKRDSGAVFQVRGEPEVVVLIRAPRPLATYDAIGITVEPAGGSPGPTGPRVLHGTF